MRLARFGVSGRARGIAAHAAEPFAPGRDRSTNEEKTNEVSGSGVVEIEHKAQRKSGPERHREKARSDAANRRGGEHGREEEEDRGALVDRRGKDAARCECDEDGGDSERIAEDRRVAKGSQKAMQRGSGAAGTRRFNQHSVWLSACFPRCPESGAQRRCRHPPAASVILRRENT
jgi:hypothetical protein